MPSAMKENSPLVTNSPAVQPWRSPWRGLVSLFLIYHLLAVIAPPLHAITYGRSLDRSPLTTIVLAVVRPYMGAMFLDHGYAFFAPEPGPLHLVRYKVEFADDRPPIEGRFPNLQEERPRLMYHRYFMMAESLESAFIPPTEPPKPVPPPANDPNRLKLHIEQEANYNRQLSQWQVRRSQYEQLRRSMIDHLEHKYPEGTATLTRVRHRLLSPPEVQYEQLRLDDPSTFIDLPEDDAPQPLPMPEVLP